MRKLNILLGVIFLSIILMSLNVDSALVLNGSNELINAFKSNTLVRLHVIANSNSPADQYIKRKIRNKIISYMGNFVDRENVDIDISRINNYINNILKVEGIEYEAEVKFGLYYFPDRTYDNLTLPAGKYRALKVVLGKGEGANWWCVLLPPMCVEDQSNGDISNQKIEFRFKLFEWFRRKKSSLKEKDVVDTEGLKDTELNKQMITKKDTNNNFIKKAKLVLNNKVINEAVFYNLINREDIKTIRLANDDFSFALKIEKGRAINTIE